MGPTLGVCSIFVLLVEFFPDLSTHCDPKDMPLISLAMPHTRLRDGLIVCIIPQSVESSSPLKLSSLVTHPGMITGYIRLCSAMQHRNYTEQI